MHATETSIKTKYVRMTKVRKTLYTEQLEKNQNPNLFKHLMLTNKINPL